MDTSKRVLDKLLLWVGMSCGCQYYQNIINGKHVCCAEVMKYKYDNEMSCQRVIQVELVRFHNVEVELWES